MNRRFIEDFDRNLIRLRSKYELYFEKEVTKDKVTYTLTHKDDELSIGIDASIVEGINDIAVFMVSSYYTGIVEFFCLLQNKNGVKYVINRNKEKK
jgi:hypothetical protein